MSISMSELVLRLRALGVDESKFKIHDAVFFERKGARECYWCKSKANVFVLVVPEIWYPPAPSAHCFSIELLGCSAECLAADFLHYIFFTETTR